jgi:hypothetical protein
MNTPTDAECNDQAVAFDILQNHVKALNQLLHNMADIDDMVDELTDAAKKEDRDDRDATAHRQARAYKLTQIVLTAAMQQQQLVEEQMADFLTSA